jgi:mannose/fructose/N-acetylgalactosamine-specific phosphotransferase system component IIC
MINESPRGYRKVRHAREMALMLLLGFCVAAWTKCPPELFAGFAAGLAGISGAFVYGNVKSNQVPEQKEKNYEITTG